MKQYLLALLAWLQRRLAGEQIALATDAPPAHTWLKHPTQRLAAQSLAGFFALLFLFTLVSRAAEGLTVPLVQAETAKSGTITERIELSGTLQPLADLLVTLPAGLVVTAAEVEVGDRVDAGDVLLRFDADNVNEQLATQQNSLASAKAKLATLQNTASSTDQSVATAELSLAQAKEDHALLTQKLTRSGSRSAQDYAAAVEAVATAEAALATAQTKARASLVEAAQTKVDTATKALSNTQSTATETIANAQYSYDQSLQTATEKLQQSVTQAETALATAQENAAEQLASAQYSYDQAAEKSGGDSAEAKRAAEQLASTRSKGEAAVAAAEAALATAEAATLPADISHGYTQLQSTIAKQNSAVADALTALTEAKTALQEAKTKSLDEEQAVVQAQNSLQSAQKAVDSAARSLEDSGTNTDEQLLSSARKITQAERSLATAKQDAAAKAVTTQNTELQTRVEILTQKTQITSLQATVQQLQDMAALGGELLSAIDGTVQQVMGTGKTAENATVATISRNDAGFVLQASTTLATAETLTLGESGQLSFSLNGTRTRLEATVTEIGAADENNKVTVKVQLPDGSYQAGIAATFNITRSSERQNTCIPVGALRSDSDGDFVLLLQEKKSVTGRSYTAVRSDVNVLLRDSSLAAVQGGLSQTDLVLCEANKPVAEGDKVRLDDETA